MRRHSEEEQLRILLDHITQSERRIMAAIDDLNTAVQANTAATQAAVAALGAVVNNDPAIEAAATTIAANTASLTAATTPAAPPAA